MDKFKVGDIVRGDFMDATVQGVVDAVGPEGILVCIGKSYSLIQMGDAWDVELIERPRTTYKAGSWVPLEKMAEFPAMSVFKYGLFQGVLYVMIDYYTLIDEKGSVSIFDALPSEESWVVEYIPGGSIVL